MSADRFDRELGAWLQAVAPSMAPDELHEVSITVVRSTRQSPRWVAIVREASLAAWSRPTLRPFSRTAVYLLMIVALLLALAFAAILAGQRTPAVPNGFIAFAAWEPSPTYDPTADRDIYLVSFGGSARRIIGSATDGLDQVCPSFSPDGKRLAYGQGVGLNASREASLEVVELDADGDPTPSQSITIGPFPPPCPVWSPDGQQIALSAPLTSPINPTRSAVGSAVWIVRLADGQITVLPDLLAIDLDWSPDGTRLAIASGRDDASPGDMHQDSLIHLYSVSTGKLLSLPGTLGVAQFSWSPQGQWIAFNGDHHDPRLRVIDVDTGRVETWASDIRAWNGSQPVWSPTGDRIAYLRNPECSECSEVVLVAPHPERGGDPASEVLTTPGDVTKPGDIEQLSTTDRAHFWSAYGIGWSPDGAYVLYHAERAVDGVFRFGLVAVPLDPGKPPVVLVDDIADDLQISAIDSDSYFPINAWGRQPAG